LEEMVAYEAKLLVAQSSLTLLEQELEEQKLLAGQQMNKFRKEK